MKKIVFVLPIIFSILFSQFAFADTPKLTNEQRDTIVMNCSSIKTSLQRLQKTDSATRVHLGTTYQNLSTRFLTPMNLRLVKNNLLSAELTNNFNDFSIGRNNFNQNFISYSRELENLLNVNCQENPDGFYEKLETVRSLRSKVAEDASYIRWLLNNHVSAVKSLKKESQDV